MQLNYQHLYYFWVVARAPSLTAAAHRLSLSPSTVSTQIKSLEERLGQPLFERRGRGLVLTERGRVALAYADDIFALGHELYDTVRSQEAHPNHLYRLRVGVSNNLPKLVAYQLLSPVTSCPDFPVHLVCAQGEASTLVADIALHHFDFVLSDQPVSLSSDLPIESQLLGECGVSIMGSAHLAESFQKGFPTSLDSAPMLLPDPDCAMRQLLEIYFHDHNLHPHVLGEFGDSALLKSFGQAGIGLFPVPSLVAHQVEQQYNVKCLGELEGIKERFYISFSAGREPNPAVKSLLKEASKALSKPTP
jgi:LysR family transcriptional regulator, transcriptional activator of nhaA